MAFVESGWDSGPTAGKGFPKIARYRSTTDNLATVKGATYFDTAIVAGNATVGDFIMVAASDGNTILWVSTVTSGVDITTTALVLD